MKFAIIFLPLLLTSCAAVYPDAYPGSVNGNVSQDYSAPAYQSGYYQDGYNSSQPVQNKHFLKQNYSASNNQNNDLSYLYNEQHRNYNNGYNNYGQTNQVQSVYCQNQGMSQLIGGVAGGALGSLFGKGYGKIGTVAAGTILGTTVAGIPCY